MGARLEPVEGGGTKVVFRLALTPRFGILRPLARRGGQKVVDDMGAAIARVDEALARGEWGHGLLGGPRAHVDSKALDRAAAELLRILPAERRTVGERLVVFIRDASDAVMPDVTVMITSRDSGQSRRGVTNPQGTVVLPLLAPGASVILTGSTAGTEGTEAFSVYAASKAAVRALARNWILDLKGRGIRVNTLSPGATRTPGLVGLAGPDAARQQGLLDHLATRIPLGRVGEAEEIAKAALFLASEDASFVNGIELFVDGGQAQI